MVNVSKSSYIMGLNKGFSAGQRLHNAGVSIEGTIIVGIRGKIMQFACVRCPKEHTFEQENITAAFVLLKSVGDFYIFGNKSAGSRQFFLLGWIFAIIGCYFDPL